MDTLHPLVSVIIPCYNSEKYLQETLDSVFQQTYPSIEIICVDNGSSDSTIDLIKKNQEKHSNLFYYQETQKGASRARNLGLKHAKGEFIQFLDSDDIIVTEKLENQVQFVLENDLDVVVSDRVVKDEQLKNQVEAYTFERIEDKPIETAITKIIITGNPIYRKSVVDSVDGYTPELPMAQDWDFHIKLFLENPKIGYLKGAFLISRNVSDSLSSDWLKVSLVSCQLLSTYFARFKEKAILQDQDVLRKVVNTYFITAIHVKDKEFRINLIKDLKQWVDGVGTCKYLSGSNKFLCKLFGVDWAIKFKSFLKKNLTSNER